ncbi:MAG: tRNA 2-thiouridine(34) synthase MnmA, partial [Calditrichaeota bacterium]
MKIAVLLSGGVDSSVALSLLRQQRQHELTAFYLKIWLEDELAYLGDCPWEEDLRYARAVCEAAEVPLEVISLQNEYY